MAAQFALRLSLIAFATASLRGVLLGAEFRAALQTSLIAMGGFYVLGLICGELARRVVEENVQWELDRWKADRANPESSKSSTT